MALIKQDLEALLLLCGDFVLSQVSNADDQNVVFHLLRLPTMPVTLDDQRKRHKKAKEKTITPNTKHSCSTQQWCKWQLMTRLSEVSTKCTIIWKQWTRRGARTIRLLTTYLLLIELTDQD